MTKATRQDPAWLRPRVDSNYQSPSKATVYLGSELLTEIRALRQQGLDINLSFVCQSALTKAVQETKALLPDPAQSALHFNRRR